MNVLKIWDRINDFVGVTPFHPQYFVIKAEKKSEQITLLNLKGNVIDIGYGRQLLKSPIQKIGLKYTGLDHPNIYKRQRGQIKPDILADITKLPIKENSFDSALLLMVLAHLPSPLAGLKEIYRILIKNGQIFVSSVENYPAHDLPDDFFRYRLSGLESILIDAGFKIVKGYSWGNVWEVNSLNFNMFLLQNIKSVWDKDKNVIILTMMLIIAYPFIFVSNILAMLLTPLDFIKSSRLINFVIAQK